MPGEKSPSEVSRVNAEEGRQDAEDLRQEADMERDSAEDHRVLEDARNTFRQLKVTKPGEVQ